MDRAASEKPDPGRTGIHHLNRAEYNNAGGDLLAVNFPPAGDACHGFDNIADVLSMPPC